VGRKTDKMLSLLNPLELLSTKKVLQVNPTTETIRDTNIESIIDLYNYQDTNVDSFERISFEDLINYKNPSMNQWINIDVLNKDTIDKIATEFTIHPLFCEDILSLNQRPKIDEIDNQVYCVMQMMYYNKLENSIESEQVSFLMGKNILITFQEDEHRDYFDTIRLRLKTENSKCRKYEIDYLLYSLIDAIVDGYYVVMEKMGEGIELLEEKIIKGETDNLTMNKINNLRKEIILFRRNIIPMRDLINGILHNENRLFNESNKRYFKDVYDHVLQAADLSDNYRDMVTNIRDLYLNQVNLKINEVMKFLAIVTALLAPATVIGGIFGMNFDKIPWLHNNYGFFLAVFLMLIIPLFMLGWFKKKQWF
jgi:magnesium transporter